MASHLRKYLQRGSGCADAVRHMSVAAGCRRFLGGLITSASGWHEDHRVDSGNSRSGGVDAVLAPDTRQPQHSNPRRVLRRQAPAAAMPWLAATGSGASGLTRGLLLGPIPMPCFDLPGRGIMEVTVPAAGAGSGVLMELRRSNREGGPNDSR